VHCTSVTTHASLLLCALITDAAISCPCRACVQEPCHRVRPSIAHQPCLYPIVGSISLVDATPRGAAGTWEDRASLCVTGPAQISRGLRAKLLRRLASPDDLRARWNEGSAPRCWPEPVMRVPVTAASDAPP
jgi:hypothetical protein